MGTTQTRNFKINWVMERVNTADALKKFIKEDKLINEFCFFFSSTKRTCLEVLDMLEANGKIVRVYDEIWTPKSLATQTIKDKEDLEADKFLENL